MQRSFFLSITLVAAAFAEQTPLKLADILAWKRIQTPLVSNDGKWFAYKLAPNDGDTEVVLRNLGTGAEQRFAIGELPRLDPFTPAGPPIAPARDGAFSEDSKWLALQAYPSVKEGKLLKKQRKPLQTKLILVELATGKKTEFEGIRRFNFSGEGSTAIAMHRYPPAGAMPAAAATPPAGATPGGAAPKPEDRPQGSDLLLYELASGNELNLGNVSDFAFNKKGEMLAYLVDAQDKLGNGIQTINMTTGAVTSLDTAKASYKGLSWTEKGDGLATLRGAEDKGWEDKLYSVVAFTMEGGSPRKFVYDPAEDKSFPKGYTVSPTRNPSWMADLSVVTFGIHEVKAKDKDKKEAKPDDSPAERPDLAIWHWKDDRLQSMQQVQEPMDKNFNFLCAFVPSEKKFVRYGDAAMRQVSAAPEHKFALGMDIREYELTSNLDGRRYQDIYKVDLKTGERQLALRKARWFMGPSTDGSHFLYYDDGSFFTYDLTNGQTHNVTKQVPAQFTDTEDDHNVVKPPTRPLGWSTDAQYVLLSDNWDIWKVPANGGPGVNLTGNGKKDKIRYRTIFRLNPDDKGIDLMKPLYVSAYGEWTKKGGIGVIEPGATGIHMLRWEDAGYPQLLKAKKAGVYLYTRETTREYPNFYSAGPDLTDGKRITDANPQQKDFLWTRGSKLIEYTGARGNKLQGALYLPANYEAGKKYPTIVYIYEKLSQAANAYPQPGFNGFSVGAYTSNGYAVLTPDIDYKVNDPGVSAVHCIMAALKAAEATGVVNPERVALHGHSWGGYQTAFTVTQTNAFRAAIAGAPLTDMISMYSGIYWNTGSTNQPIFESSQGRFTSGPWDNTEAYIRNSPVYHAKNVQTPLLILHNDKDGAVDHTQGIEYYNTLRRLGKTVVMLEYKGENHGLRKPENMKDYTVRTKEFFDYYLMDKPAPKWFLEGVPRLKMNDELEQREKQITQSGTPPVVAPSQQ